MFTALLMGILVMYLVLVMQFGSFTAPVPANVRRAVLRAWAKRSPLPGEDSGRRGRQQREDEDEYA